MCSNERNIVPIKKSSEKSFNKEGNYLLINSSELTVVAETKIQQQQQQQPSLLFSSKLG
jgi:hypothetical protein